MLVADAPGRRHRLRADRRRRAGALARAGRDRRRQARRHREQGAARAARQRDLRRRAGEGRDGRVRGGGRRRHPDHQGAARGPHREPHRVDRRHHQRHLELHPVDDARHRRVVRRRCSPRRRSAATPRPTRPSTSRASTPRTSSRSWRRSPSACRCDFAGAYHEGITKLTREDIRYAEELGYRIKLLGIARAAPGRLRAARAPDAGAEAAPDRQRRGRDERGAGEGRRGRRDACTTAPAPAPSRPPPR